jgi:biuret amidohydrolase
VFSDQANRWTIVLVCTNIELQGYIGTLFAGVLLSVLVIGNTVGETGNNTHGRIPNSNENGRVMQVEARPFPFAFSPTTTALIIIDMQRDFLEPGGFGELLGNDVSLLRTTITPTSNVLAAARKAGLLVLHTREGHRPDLTDCPPAKLTRGGTTFIGTDGPMGRILVRGERGHDIIDELKPLPGEPIIDKPGKGSFYSTDLELILRERGIRSLLVCGVTTEVCVHTTVREANDRGFDCLVLEDCVGSYFPEFQRVAIAMFEAQGAIFAWVGQSATLLSALR